MDYDAEREKRKSEEIRKEFRLLFPLCMEEELPWAACQIGGFLRKRIEFEVRENTDYFARDVARVLCEVTRPKTHIVDMVRIVVEELKTSRNLINTYKEKEKQHESKKEN